MSQPKVHDLKDVLVPLNAEQEKELVQLLKNPSVIQYFRNVAFQAMFEMAEHSRTNFNPIEQAYQQGVLHMANTVLNITPKE